MVSFANSLVEKYQAVKGMFRFEITESVLMENPRFIQEQVKSLSENGYVLKNVTLDLYNNMIENNIETEYEKKFANNNIRICRLEAYKK